MKSPAFNAGSKWFILVIAVLFYAPMSPAANGANYGATLTPVPPARAVVVPPSKGALSAAIGSHGKNTTFFLKAGVHTGNGVMRPKAGSVFIGETGSILDGENTTTRSFFHDPDVIPFSSDAPRYVVILRNLTIRNYAPADQDCAVMIEGTGQGWRKVLTDRADRNGWLLDHCTFTANRAGGAFLGSASTARNCLASYNGQLGFKATGRKVQFLNCRSTANNKDRKFNYFWEAGGMKCWNVKELLIDGGEYDHNGGMGAWLDYVWDGNVIRNAHFHDNYRAGISIEMAVGAEVTGCRLIRNDTDGIAGVIPVAFRPWDPSPKSGPDLRTGEIFLFNGSAAGTYVDPTTQTSSSFTGKTRIHANRIRNGNGGVMTLYQDRGGVDPLGQQMQGSKNGPVAGLGGIVVENNDIHSIAGYAAGVNILVQRDYKDAAGSYGPIPAAQAQTQYQAARYRRNRYSGNLTYCVPRAATLGGSANVWDWNERVDIDLKKWYSLGKD